METSPAIGENFALELDTIELKELGKETLTVKKGDMVVTYAMDNPPQFSNIVVAAQRHDILGTIDLSKLMFQLTLCPDLYRIAYCATYGVTEDALGAKVQTLNSSFYDQLIKSTKIVGKFQYQATSISRDLVGAYYLLLEPETYQDAIDIISIIGQKAACMAEESEKMASSFGELRSETSDCLEKVTSTSEKLHAKYIKFQEDERKLNASMEAYKELVNNYDRRVKALQEDIDETKADIKAQEKRADELALASIIVNAVQGVTEAVAAGIAASRSINVGTGTTQTPGDTAKTQPQPQTAAAAPSTAAPVRDEAGEKKYTATLNGLNTLKADAATLKTEKDNLDTAISDLVTKISALGSDMSAEKTALETSLAEKRQQLSTKQQEIADNQIKIDASEQTVAAYKLALENLGYSFDKVSGSLLTLSENAERKAETKQAQLADLRKQKNQMEDVYITNLANMKKTAELIKNSQTDQKDVDAAVNSLIVAIGALNQVVSFLGCLTTFWNNIANSCTFLTDNSAQIKRLSKSAVLMKSNFFVFSYYKMTCYWTALGLIFSEYEAAFSKAFAAMNTNYQKSAKTPQEHWKEAAALAEEVSAKLGYEISQAETKKLKV